MTPHAFQKTRAELESRISELEAEVEAAKSEITYANKRWNQDNESSVRTEKELRATISELREALKSCLIQIDNYRSGLGAHNFELCRLNAIAALAKTEPK